MAKKTLLTRRITRRETLGLIGGAAVAAVVGCGGDDEPSATPEASATRTTSRTASASATTAAATTSPTAAPVACVLTLEETEGPYFVDERLNRSDLTSDPSDGSVSEGVPLQLDLTVSEVNGATCTPLAGAVVDMWHCDALGSYSDVSAGMGQSSHGGPEVPARIPGNGCKRARQLPDDLPRLVQQAARYTFTSRCGRTRTRSRGSNSPLNCSSTKRSLTPSSHRRLTTRRGPRIRRTRVITFSIRA